MKTIQALDVAKGYGVKFRGLLLAVGMALAAAPDSALTAGAVAAKPAPVVLNTTRTELPSGATLYSGGSDGSGVASGLLSVLPLGAEHATPLTLGLIQARSGHTSTLLPDGRVFIHGGGRTPPGQLAAQSEIIDLEAGMVEAMRPTGLTARSGHVATVLSDGSVLFAGGTGKDGARVQAIERFDSVNGSSAQSKAELPSGFTTSSSRLLMDGSVLITGHVGGEQVSALRYFAEKDSIEILSIDDLKKILSVDSPPNSVSTVAATFPRNGAGDVAPDARIVLRFTTPIKLESINRNTVTLLGPDGEVDIRVVPVDDGMLAFITPGQQLLPASAYSMFVKGARDRLNREVPLVAMSFETTQLIPGSALDHSGTTDQTSRGNLKTASSQSYRSSEQPARAIAEAETDEAWVPSAADRRGNWLSRRAHLAHHNLPINSELRELIKSHTPHVHDAAKLIHHRRASRDTVHERRENWRKMHDAFVLQTDPMNLRALRNTSTAGDGTSLSGQLLKSNGAPLSNATLRVGNVSVLSDFNGEFTLRGIPSGNQVIVIDGRTANTKNASYGRYEYAHFIEAAKSNLLPFTIWMPKLDTKHAIRISSPTRRDTVISNPSMPGLEITIPAGSVIRDADGRIVTEVTLTPIPVDQAPYPMPYAGVPLHYTIQPGGAVIQGIDGKPKGAVVRYPNYTDFGPQTPVQLFDYDAKGRGWYVYREGKVSADGASITSDRDFLIYQFATTSYSAGGPPPPPPPPPTCSGPGPGSASPSSTRHGGGSSGAGSARSGCGGDPVDLFNGSFRQTERDLYVEDIIPIDILRTYRGGRSTDGNSSLKKAFGTDTTNQYEVYLYFTPNGPKQVQVVMADGAQINFGNPSPSASYATSVFQSTSSHGDFRNATIHKDGSIYTYILSFRDGRRWGFSIYSARLTWIEDRLGNRMSFTRPSNSSYIKRITSPNGRYVDFTYNNSSGLIASVIDNIGRQFTYSYSGTDNLLTATDPDSKTRTYVWDTSNRLKEVIDPNGNTVVSNTYEVVDIPAVACPGGTTSSLTGYKTFRVVRQTLADSSSFLYKYSSRPTMVPICSVDQVALAPSSTTDITDRRGTVRRVEFDTAGNVVRNTAAFGLPEQQVTTFEYNNNLLTRRTDALNRATVLEYDTAGNLSKVTQLAGTIKAASVSATYDSVFNQPLSITDPLGHSHSMNYDPRGNLISVTDALRRVTKFEYNDQGLLASVINPLYETVRFSYSGADLAGTTDPIGRITQQQTDAAGRVLSTIDPLGNVTLNTWDSLNRLIRVTDAMDGITKFIYDNNSNLLSHIDAKNQRTDYTYHHTGQVKSKTDPLSNTETYLYEPGGGLKQRTDRKGQVSGITYDALGRVKSIGFGATAAAPSAFSSTILLTWDNANRLTQIVDTEAGASTSTFLEYDLFDRLTKESTGQGTLLYWYDAAGRRTKMMLKNGGGGFPSRDQPSVNYTWDDANRLTLIEQAAGPSNANQAQTVAFQYDDADRVTKTTYTGGMSVNTTYTNAGEVKTLKYLKADGSVIAQGGYTYDLAGRRTGVSGDLANFISTQEPDITDVSYNAANQLLSWGGKSFGYDANGNMTGDGATTYTWDARDQLVNIANATTPASFRYDSQGRRTARTVGSATTAFNFDGDNFIQELDALGRGSSIRANLITGGIDQHFMRQTFTTDAQGNKVPSLSWVMAEANNSTVVQADGAGNVQKAFQYTPYGSSIATTGTSTDSQRYTGREEDGTGLYYYRSRYYRPDCMRFISEDPLGWASGQTNGMRMSGVIPSTTQIRVGTLVSLVQRSDLSEMLRFSLR